MMSVTAFPELAPLFDQPNLPTLVAAMRQHLDDEQVRRQRFREELLPHIKAEFINGQFFMHSPSQWRHTLVSERLVSLLSPYVRKFKLGRIGFEKVLVAADRNDYEPDIIFYGPEKAATLQPDQLIFPPPDLAVEILSPSTERNDRGVKFRDYALSGVSEYWLINPETERIERFLLAPVEKVFKAAGEFSNRQPSEMLTSAVVPNFSVPVRALFDDEVNAAALAALLSGGPPT